MRVWRLTRGAYSRDPLSGAGAARAGSRWNSIGAHRTRETVPEDLVLVLIDVPDDVVEKLDVPPAGWNELPFSMAAREWDDQWVASRRSLAMMVPSVVLSRERNVLINPGHRSFPKVKIHEPEEAAIDRRLLR